MAAVQRHFRKGDTIFREAEAPRCMYLIKKGAISIRKAKGGAHVEIARVYSNEILGELSFFDRLPRSAAAVALSEVEVLEIEFEALDSIYEGVPDYLKSIIVCVADRLRKADDTIKRLQKNLVNDKGEVTEEGSSKDEPDLATVLAASVPIDPVTKLAILPPEEEKTATPADTPVVTENSDKDSDSKE